MDMYFVYSNSCNKNKRIVFSAVITNEQYDFLKYKYKHLYSEHDNIFFRCKFESYFFFVNLDSKHNI